MARPWVRWLSRIAIAAVVVAALVLPVAFPETTTTIATVIATKIRSLPPASVTAMVVEIIVGALLVALAAIWWLWWQLPRRQVARLSLKIRDPKARADVEDNFRKTVGQVLGGAAVLIGAGAAYLQFTQQQQASHDLLISNQVSKGFEQLAGTETAMRLGGIYALEGVMNAPSSQYRVPVLEALCAFVRDSTTRHQVTLTTFLAALFPAAHDKTVGNGNDAPATDVQAALTVIGRRNPGLGSVNLAGANIPGAFLRRAHLEDADLGGAHLERAVLGGAHLERAHLSEAHLERALLVAAHLEGAFLRGAHLERAVLVAAHLERAVLYGAHLEGADLIEAHLEDADLREAHLDRAFLFAAHLERADLSEAHLEGALLVAAYLERADLRGAHLERAVLSADGLTQAQIEVALGDAATELPPRLTRPAHWTAPTGGGGTAPAR